ncbi:hypothetical protein NPIL_402001 [Nephila pilipes]|uniref:Uncharacterized protein n=1 Tax=Nephila pilipes TaxID=299642 RepID=A0A8X6NJL1_NEPPI|nr:hypothetical protein NPIL_402001 [Nephila pilipes]
MHFDNRITLAGKLPNSDYETNLEMKEMELESARTKTAEIQGKLELLLSAKLNPPPKTAKKSALDQNNGENSTFISPKKTAKQPKLNKNQPVGITNKFSVLKINQSGRGCCFHAP